MSDKKPEESEGASKNVPSRLSKSALLYIVIGKARHHLRRGEPKSASKLLQAVLEVEDPAEVLEERVIAPFEAGLPPREFVSRDKLNKYRKVIERLREVIANDDENGWWWDGKLDEIVEEVGLPDERLTTPEA